jgi:DNA-binding SARP family transcriptional activator
VVEILKAVEVGEAHPLLLDRPQIADELLAGMEAVDPAFRVWLIAKRNTLRDRLLFALETAMANRSTGSRAESRLASATLNLDPTHEDACRRLMMARASNGDLAGALRLYKAISDLLLKDYDLEPSPATKSLLADIKAGVLPGKAIQTEDAGSQRSPKGAARLAIALGDRVPSAFASVTGPIP